MARQPNPKQLDYYGLERLGYADSIPVTGNYTADQLAIEMICYRISHRRSEGGLDRFGHMMEGVRLLWDNPDVGSAKKFVRNPWADRMLKAMCENDELGIAGPTSAGKCFNPDTTVLMFDGTTRRVGDIVPGDVVMGDDSTPRTVQEIHRGHGPMYRVTPADGGMAWECNGDHLLVIFDIINGHISERSAKSFIDTRLADQPQFCQGRVTDHGMSTTRITVTPIGDGDWVGFSVDGNHRFLLSDFTVVHNSDPAALYTVWSYICDPSMTLAMVMSTTLSGAKRRVWKTLREYWEGIPNLPGKPLWSTNEILGLSYEGTDFGRSSGIYLLASEQSNEKGALDKLIGVKSPRIGEFGASFEELIERPEYCDLRDKFDEDYLRDLIPRLQNLSNDRMGKLILVVDEATGCSESIWNAVQTNLKPGNVGSFQSVWLGNPDSRFNTFGLACKPDTGWNSVTERDAEWPTTTGGLCIRFDGEQNPRITGKNEKFSWMLRAEDIQSMRDTYGEKSPYYYRMVKGFWAPMSSEAGIYSEADMVQSGANVKAVWGYQEPTILTALDPSFVQGGDKASCSFGKLGYDADGLMVLELTEQVPIKVDITNVKVPVSHQIVRGWMRESQKRGVSSYEAAYDITGAPSFGDIVRMEWGTSVMAVNSGGKASPQPVGTETHPDGRKVTCAERYFNKATEIWMGAMPFLRSKQLRGITDSLANELCSRQFDAGAGKMDGRTMRVESKRIYKAREGKSPDDSDSYLILVELAKKRHGFRPAERAAVDTIAATGRSSWEAFKERARRITAKKRTSLRPS